MSNTDLIVFGFLGLCALLGFMRGFEKQVSKIGKGLVGFIVVGILVFSFGGFLLSLSGVQGLMAQLQGILQRNNAGFLATGILFVIIQYVLLFIALSIVLKVLLSLIGGLVGKTQSKSGTFFNRLFGAIVSLAVGFCLVFLAFVVVAKMPDNGATVAEIQNSVCKVLYNNNPFLMLFT